MFTEEQILLKAGAGAKSNSHLAVRRQINKLFRAQDESHLVSGKFNVTDRAIRRANKFERANGVMSPYEYIYFISLQIFIIVNRV